jgi:hypothetical protein
MLILLNLLPRLLDIIYTYNNRSSSEFSPLIFWDNPWFLYLILYIKISLNQIIFRGGNQKNVVYCYFYILVFIYIKNNIFVYIKLKKSLYFSSFCYYTLIFCIFRIYIRILGFCSYFLLYLYSFLKYL